MTPADLIVIDRGAVDWAALREQKATLFAMTFQLGIRLREGNVSEKDRRNYERLEGLLGFLDYIQDRAAESIGYTAVFGKDTDDQDEG